MDKNGLLTKIALQIGEKIRERATVQGRIPFLSGDLRKSIQAKSALQAVGEGEVEIISSLVYARAVHDGRPAITIRPRKAKMLAWKPKGSKKFIFAKEVHQPARKGRPFITEGAEEMAAQGFDFLNPLLHEYVSDSVADQIVSSIDINFKL